MRRLFSKAQRRFMYVVSDGCCRECGGDLGEDWEAHHKVRYADGGVTELTNGEPLCRACHQLKHKVHKMIEPRGWQRRALRDFTNERKSSSFLLEATPGSGKTIFAGLCANHRLTEEGNTFVVAVVPTTALKGDDVSGFLGDWHKCGVSITTMLRDGKPRPKAYQGACITYAQLPNMVSTFETWAKRGEKMFFVFDEVHHLTEANEWGRSAARCNEIATAILCMTGTPFRGDREKISFVRYDDEGKCIPDFSFSYREAVSARVCRKVSFIADDAVAEWIRDEEEHSGRVSKADDDNGHDIARVVFDRDAEFVERVLLKADQVLESYRRYDADAGGLIVCRPGETEFDGKHLRQIAEVVKRTLGEAPVVVSSDDSGSDENIARFRKSDQKWMCAVRKVSEGVDIKRLRVLVLLNRPTTELLFRQLVGRVVRQEDQTQDEDSTVLMAKFPGLEEWARRIADEAEAGLKERGDSRDRNSGDDDGPMSIFVRRGDTHEDGDLITDFGETYSVAEQAYADKLKRGDPQLVSVPTSTVLHLIRKAEVDIPPLEDVGIPPEHEIKKRLRKEINKSVKRTAFACDPVRPPIWDVWRRLHRKVGVKDIDDLMDNHDSAKMQQVLDMLKQWESEAR